MKSMVCKKANELIRNGKNRSEAFRTAWAVVKSAPQNVKASELKRGNVIRVEYGDYNNYVTCTVESKSDDLFLGEYYVINAVSNNGMKIEFCAEPDELIERVAA